MNKTDKAVTGEGKAPRDNGAIVEEIEVLPVSNDYLEQVIAVQERNARTTVKRQTKGKVKDSNL